ncbi:MAG: glycosyltransferase family 4 protein [Candidatus Shapirobacteria bacterium]|nr:glycosyltransferase family 4 protein [Candidatus Shapirobacteria bacterium]
MKILAISHIFPPAIDGGSKVVYKLGQYFESQKHQVLYLSSNCFSTDDFVNSKSIKTDSSYKNFIKLPVYNYLRRPLKFLNFFLPQKSYLYELSKVFQKGPIFKLIPFIKTIIKITKFKPDLIIAGPLPTTIILYARFLKNLTRSKLLINASFHQTDLDFFQLPLIKTLQKTDFLWTLTQYETNFFIKKFNINPQKIILAGNGVDPEFIIKKNKIKKSTNHDSPSTILFIGNLSFHKRVDLLIKSFSSLISKNLINQFTNKLIIVGQKTLFYPQLKKLYDSLDPQIKNKIKFKFNIITQKQLIKTIDDCQFLVLPSIQESFGLVLIEAWARSKPVITTNIPPLQELVTKSKGGLTFKIDDSVDLQKQIQKLLNNSKLCNKLGQNGLDYVKNNYTWKKVGQKICQKI